MKKSTFVVVVVLALALCVPAVAFAALSPSSPMAIGSRSAAATCPNYADRNANGACDRHENGACPSTRPPTAMASATTTKTARALGIWMPTATAYATTAPVLERTARATWMPTVMASATTTAAGTARVMAMAVTMAAVTAALAKQTLRVREICP